MLLRRSSGALTFYDERDYHAIGQSLAKGLGFFGVHGPTAFRPPGQPVFLGLVYAWFGPSPQAAMAIQCLLLATLPFAAVRVTRLVSRHPLVSVGAAGLAAFHPGLSYAALSLYPAVLTAVLLTWGIVFAAEGLIADRQRQVLVGAALLGLAAAFTPYFAPMPLVVAALSLVRRRAFATAALSVALGLLPLGAWGARNAVTLGTFTLSTTSGLNLVLGANDEATPRSGNWIEPPALPEADARDELTRDRAYRAIAHRWIAAHPVRWTALSVARAVTVLDSVGRPKTPGRHEAALAKLAGFAILPIVLFGLYGVFVFRRSMAAQLTGAALACVVVAAAPTLAKPRFRFPCDPSLAGLAAAGIGALSLQVRAARTKKERRCPA